MKLTLTVIKADIGSIGGHVAPSRRLLETVEAYIHKNGINFLIDYNISHTGDDIAILMTHRRGEGNEDVHNLAWNAFLEGTAVAKQQGLYGAGQDLLKEAFSGNVKGMGPAVAEMEIEERPNEPFLFFAADKTDPGAYNLPLYLAFADPMNTPGLLLSPHMSQGFKFVIMDVNFTEGDRVIELNAPEQLYDIAALLRDPERFVVESIWSRASGEQAVAVATTRLHNIAGKYTGKDDPVMLVRVQMNFPATGEVLAPYAIGHFVAGGMRGSHQMPLMPVAVNTGISYFDGPPVGELRRLLRPQRDADRTRRQFRATVLERSAGSCGAQIDRDAPPRLLWRGHVADERAGVHRDRGKARCAREAIRGAARGSAGPRS